MASTYHPVVPSTTEAVKAVQGEQKGNHELATEEDLSPGSFMQGILREFCFAFRLKNRKKILRRAPKKQTGQGLNITELPGEVETGKSLVWIF